MSIDSLEITSGKLECFRCHQDSSQFSIDFNDPHWFVYYGYGDETGIKQCHVCRQLVCEDCFDALDTFLVCGSACRREYASRQLCTRQNRTTEKRQVMPESWSCECCRKHFKSQGQLDTHKNSNKHKKAEKQMKGSRSNSGDTNCIDNDALKNGLNKLARKIAVREVMQNKAQMNNDGCEY